MAVLAQGMTIIDLSGARLSLSSHVESCPLHALVHVEPSGRRASVLFGDKAGRGRCVGGDVRRLGAMCDRLLYSAREFPLSYVGAGRGRARFAGYGGPDSCAFARHRFYLWPGCAAYDHDPSARKVVQIFRELFRAERTGDAAGCGVGAGRLPGGRGGG